MIFGPLTEVHYPVIVRVIWTINRSTLSCHCKGFLVHYQKYIILSLQRFCGPLTEVHYPVMLKILWSIKRSTLSCLFLWSINRSTPSCHCNGSLVHQQKYIILSLLFCSLTEVHYPVIVKVLWSINRSTLSYHCKGLWYINRSTLSFLCKFSLVL